MGSFGRVILASVLAFALVSAMGCARAVETTGSDTGGQEPYKLGAILSLTGTYAGLGQPERDVLEMEVKAINDAGGINGRPIELLIEDDGTDEAKAVAAASRLIEREGVIALIGASGTGQSMAVRDQLQRSGVPQVSMAGGTVITKEFDPLVFQTPWSNTIVVPFVLDAMKAAGHTKVALLSDSGGYGKDGRDIVLEAAPDAGIEIVSDQTFNPGDTDLSTQMTRIKTSAPDAVLIWTAGKEGALALKNARDLGMTQPFFGGSGQAREEFVTGAGEAAEGFVFGTGRSLVPANWPAESAESAAVVEFAEAYKAEYGKDPDIFAGHAHDALAIIVDALKRAKTDDPAELRDAIEQTKDLPGFGGSFTFSATDHNGLTADDLALYRVENGAWVTFQ